MPLLPLRLDLGLDRTTYENNPVQIEVLQHNLNIMSGQFRQPIHKVQDLYALYRFQKYAIHRKDDLWVVVADHLQWAQFSCPCFLGLQGFCHLYVQLFLWSCGNEIYFGFAHLSDEDMVIPSEKFQIDEIFQDMPSVHVPIS